MTLIPSGRRRRRRDMDDLASAFLLSTRVIAGNFEAEYRFDPERAWALDAAWPARLLACEFHGGIHPIYVTTKRGDRFLAPGGRHVTAAGFTADRAKMNEAALQGWLVLELVPSALASGDAWRWFVRAWNSRPVKTAEAK